jgi:hypothetical protein
MIGFLVAVLAIVAFNCVFATLASSGRSDGRCVGAVVDVVRLDRVARGHRRGSLGQQAARR